MNRLSRSLRSEWTKVFSTNVWWALALVMVVYIGFTAATMGLMLSGLIDDADAQAIPNVDPRSIYTLGSSMGYIFPVLIGSLAVTGEWRHRTITPTFLAAGARGPVLVGKSIVQFGVGLFYGALALTSAVLASVFLVTYSGGPSELGETDTWLFFLRSILVMGVWAVVGVGLGTLVRNQTTAIVIVIVFTQFIEPLARLGATFNDAASSIAQFLPGSVTDAFVGDSLYTAMTSGAPGVAGGVGASPLNSWVAFAVLSAYAATILLAGWFFRWRNADVT